MNEIWKPIKGSKRKAFVSNMGNIKQNGEILEPHYDAEGYQRVSVYGVGRKRVHVYVAEAFLPNPENKPMVDHINNVKDDNRAKNLQWVTPKENAMKAGKDGLIKVRRGYKPIAGIAVIDNIKKTLIFGSQAEAERVTGVRSKDINKCLRNKRNTAGGWVFGYIQ